MAMDLSPWSLAAVATQAGKEGTHAHAHTHTRTHLRKVGG